MSNEKEIDLIQLFNVIWSKRKAVLKWALMGMVVGVVVAVSLSKSYRSSIILAPEGSKNSNSSSMGALAGVMGMSLAGAEKEGVNDKIYPRIFKSTPYLLEFAHIPVQYKGVQMPLYHYLFEHQKRAWWSYVFSLPGQTIDWIGSIGSERQPKIPFDESPELQSAFVDVLSAQIKIDVMPEDNLLEISTQMQDPVIAQQMADSLYVELGEYMARYRTQKSRKNLDASIESYNKIKEKYYYADSLYAQVVDRNQNLTSETAKIKIERLRNERTMAYSIYQQLATQVEMDRIKLQEDTPIATVIEPSSTPFAASSPNKKVVIILFAMLGAFALVSKIVYRELTKK